MTTLKFAGMKFKLSGVWPEFAREDPPGVLSVDVGKEHVRAYIETNGGTVTSSVSRRTTYLVTGAKPGPTSVKKALDLNVPCVTFEHVRALVDETPVPSPEPITEFSEGPFQNGLAVYMTPAQKRRLASEADFAPKRRRAADAHPVMQNAAARRALVFDEARARRDA